MGIGRTVAAVLLAAGTGLAGCTYTGTYGDNPVVRKFSWFSYLNGDDLRPHCTAGAPDRLRMVYNAVYQRQVRAYDLVALEAPADGEAARLIASVTSEANLREMELDPAAPDLLAPWRAKGSETRLRPEDLDRLRAALVDSGVTGPSAIGLELDSEGFYWLVAGCLEGQWRFTGYRWPSDAFDGLTFDDYVAGLPQRCPTPQRTGGVSL